MNFRVLRVSLLISMESFSISNIFSLNGGVCFPVKYSGLYLKCIGGLVREFSDKRFMGRSMMRTDLFIICVGSLYTNAVANFFGLFNQAIYFWLFLILKETDYIRRTVNSFIVVGLS